MHEPSRDLAEATGELVREAEDFFERSLDELRSEPERALALVIIVLLTAPAS